MQSAAADKPLTADDNGARLVAPRWCAARPATFHAVKDLTSGLLNVTIARRKGNEPNGVDCAVGHGTWGSIPFLGGHTLHFGGSNTLKRIRFYPGGSPDFTHSWIPAA